VNRDRSSRAERAAYPIAVLCRTPRVSRAGHYARAGRGAAARARAAERLAARIATIHARRRRTYGAPRAHAELRAEGGRCARKRVARLMRAAGLVGCHRRRARTTVADPAHTPAPNLIARDFAAAGPSRLRLGAITYPPTREGRRYLAVLLDAHSRRVVGRAMADRLRTGLTLDALAMALRSRCPPPGPIHHPDRGGRYTAAAYQPRLAARGIACSMSRAGQCLDEAMAGSFFATLKAEVLDERPWPTRVAARRAAFGWLEAWYNRQRRHSALAYRSPVAHEKHALLLQGLAA
jgi:putative transposase